MLENADRFELWSALNRVLRRLEERTREGRVEAEKISVSDCMDSVRALLAQRGGFLFTELFPAEGPISRLLLAASFLAVLELSRLGVMTLSQSADFEDIQCRALPPADATARPERSPQMQTSPVPCRRLRLQGAFKRYKFRSS